MAIISSQDGLPALAEVPSQELARYVVEYMSRLLDQFRDQSPNRETLLNAIRQIRCIIERLHEWDSGIESFNSHYERTKKLHGVLISTVRCLLRELSKLGPFSGERRKRIFFSFQKYAKMNHQILAILAKIWHLHQ
jgi:hypothetical protein